MRRDFQPLADRVNIEWFNDLPFGEMLKRAATMPPKSAILWVLLSEDAAGIPYSQDSALEAMREVSAVPIFGTGDFEIGRGIVGGPLIQTRALGREAADVALRIFKGEKPAAIDPRYVPLGAPIYDWRRRYCDGRAGSGRAKCQMKSSLTTTCCRPCLPLPVSRKCARNWGAVTRLVT
jgi:hypothetical protein